MAAGNNSPAQPSTAPADASLWLDPFCALYATAQPIYTSPSEPLSPISNVLAVGVFAEAGARADAHVTLLSDTGAYDAFLQDVPLADDGKGLRSHNILVQLPKAMRVRFVYVDSFAVNGGTEASCPVGAVRPVAGQDDSRAAAARRDCARQRGL